MTVFTPIFYNCRCSLLAILVNGEIAFVGVYLERLVNLPVTKQLRGLCLNLCLTPVFREKGGANSLCHLLKAVSGTYGRKLF